MGIANFFLLVAFKTGNRTKTGSKEDFRFQYKKKGKISYDSSAVFIIHEDRKSLSRVL